MAEPTSQPQPLPTVASSRRYPPAGPARTYRASVHLGERLSQWAWSLMLLTPLALVLFAPDSWSLLRTVLLGGALMLLLAVPAVVVPVLAPLLNSAGSGLTHERSSAPRPYFVRDTADAKVEEPRSNVRRVE